MPLQSIPLVPLAAPVAGELLSVGLPADCAELLAGAITTASARRWFSANDAEYLEHVRSTCVPFISQLWQATGDPAAVILGTACGMASVLIPASWPPGRPSAKKLTVFQGDDPWGNGAQFTPRKARAAWARWAGSLVHAAMHQFPAMQFDSALAQKALAKPLTPWLTQTGSWDCTPDHVARVISRLVTAGRIDLRQHLDAKLIAGRRALRSFNSAIFADVGSLERILDFSYPCEDSVWSAVLDIMRSLPDEELGAFAQGAFDAFSRWLSVRFHCQALTPGAEWALARETIGGATYTWDRSLDIANSLVPITRHLNERVAPHGASRHQFAVELRIACWVYTWRAFDGRAYKLPEAVAKRHATEASAFLGSLRSIARSANKEASATDFAAATKTAEHALRTLTTFGQLWDATKQLVLLLSYLQVPATPPDTRYWTEHGEPAPPAPWEWVPRMIAAVMHTFARRTEKKDPGLVEYREALADFCLQRLRSRDNKPTLPLGDEGMVEPRRCWRMAYLRALSELRVNPRGAGQRTLNWLASHDPDRALRDSARSAADLLKRVGDTAPKNPADVNRSARRAIYTAFWWFRRAALEGIGVAVDEDGAQSVLARESRQDHDHVISVQPEEA